MLKTSWKYALALVCAATLACNSGKAPAEAAMKLAEEAVNGAQRRGGEAGAGRLQVALGRPRGGQGHDRQGRLQGGPRLGAGDPAEGQRRARQGQGEEGRAHGELEPAERSVPKMVEAIKSRVDILSQSQEAPEGHGRGQLASAKDGLAARRRRWDEAQEAFKAGKWTDAIAKGTTVKDKATEVMATLGMEAGRARQPGEVTLYRFEIEGPAQAGPFLRPSLPLDRGRRLRRDVVDHAVDAAHAADDPAARSRRGPRAASGTSRPS